MSVNYHRTTSAGLSWQLYQTRQSINSQQSFSQFHMIWGKRLQFKKYLQKLGTEHLIRHDQCAASRGVLRKVRGDERESWRGWKMDGYLLSDWDAQQRGQTSWGAGDASLIDTVREPRQRYRSSAQKALTNVRLCLEGVGCVSSTDKTGGVSWKI